MEERKDRRTFTEEIEIAGHELVESIKRLIAEGNVREVRIIDAEGGVYLKTPLTIGAIAGGVITLAAPWLAVLGVIAALVTRIRVEIIRDEGERPEGGD